MPVTVEQMASNWRRRETARAERAASRGARLLSHLAEARRVLVEKHGAARVWLFGSLATGRPREDSDVDLAVEGLAASVYFQALADLLRIFDAPVDLVRIEEAPPSLCDRVFSEGRLL